MLTKLLHLNLSKEALMIQGIVDRIEGEYVVVEFAPQIGSIFTYDILRDNLDPDIKEGDVLKIYSIDHVEMTENNTCVYKDLLKADTLKKYLAPLTKKVECEILIDRALTEERSEHMKDLISSIFSK